MTFVVRWGPTLILAAWAWIAVVLGVTFWRVWDIPKRLPEINAIATEHLFLVPVSLLLFFALSWIRRQRDEAEGNLTLFPRWRSTLAIWLLAFLHPVSCGLYPSVFNLDSRTTNEITSAVSQMQVGMSRAEVERQIVALNTDLPIAMETNRAEHEAHARAVTRYLSTPDPGSGSGSGRTSRARFWSLFRGNPMGSLPVQARARNSMNAGFALRAISEWIGSRSATEPEITWRRSSIHRIGN